MRRSFALLAATLLTGALTVPAASAVDGDEGFTLKDPRITESSGLAASRLHPGVYWTHNDQDDGPYLYAVDGGTGETVARIALSGVGTLRDVEAVSMGPGDKIYVGDIGDNLGGTWPHVWIYELPEPTELKDRTVRATQYVVKYADGARDAESMVVHPKTGRVYIIDKNEDGGHLYEGPEKLSASGTNVFEPTVPVDLWATDAAFSPDGERLAVRGYLGGIWYDWNGGEIRRGGRISVPLGQGESATYTTDGRKLLLGMEGAESPVEAVDAPGGGGEPGSGAEGEGSGTGGAAADGTGGEIKIGAAAAVAVLCVLLFRVLRRRNR
ncbi:WD40 repeat domain-containing protein [Streptomyces sp. NPDC018955]|uniref:WD40 repeat domain-containing protein n=1 Tax=Streptomyces sp. NPDC018955 TaxID=3365055 RepID=UPI003796B58A